MAVARALARAGADIILGAHAHVAQPAEVLLLNGFGDAANSIDEDGCCDEERAALAALPAASRLAGAPGPPRKALVLYCLGAWLRSGAQNAQQLCDEPTPLADILAFASSPLHFIVAQATSAARCSTSCVAWARC